MADLGAAVINRPSLWPTRCSGVNTQTEFIDDELTSPSPYEFVSLDRARRSEAWLTSIPRVGRSEMTTEVIMEQQVYAKLKTIWERVSQGFMPAPTTLMDTRPGRQQVIQSADVFFDATGLIYSADHSGGL
jgi:hypothetical protein